MKYVKLDYGRQIAISEDAFAQIQALVAANKVCRLCDTLFTPERPNVSRNLCLAHFLDRNAHFHLTYVRQWETDERGETIHWFIDPTGYIHTTSSGSEDVTKSTYATLLHWGFPVPETTAIGEDEQPLSQWRWSIYGNVTTDPVVLLSHTLSFGGNTTVTFLSYRDGTVVPLNPRKGEGRRLFQQAKQLLEATRTEGKGAYHWNGHSFFSLENYWLMHVVAHLASQEYHTAQQAASTEPQEEHHE